MNKPLSAARIISAVILPSLLVTLACYDADFARADTLYAVDPYYGIEMFTSTGVRSQLVATNNPGSPQAIAFDASGSLYVSEFEGGAIYKLNSGAFTQISPTGVSGSIGFDTAGDLYAIRADNSILYKITPIGGITTVATGVGSIPKGVVVDGSDNAFVSLNQQPGHPIVKIDTHGNQTTFFSGLSHGVYEPDAMAFDKSGNLYAVFDLTGVIEKIDPSGNGTFFGQLPYDPTSLAPAMSQSGIAIDSAGDVFVSAYGAPASADYGNQDDGIYKFTPNGAISLFAEPVGREGYWGLAFAPDTSNSSDTPEPGSFALLFGATIVGLGIIARRSRFSPRERS